MFNCHRSYLCHLPIYLQLLSCRLTGYYFHLSQFAVEPCGGLVVGDKGMWRRHDPSRPLHPITVFNLHVH
uniref:Predicted protein n=1 Tax=Hordeum vulgare subsp. vulgare TaxID=112509 RepID=F2DVW3_HORVV|nr:predicted protein [Hordeum vulgare subsp. vulgare]